MEAQHHHKISEAIVVRIYATHRTTVTDCLSDSTTSLSPEYPYKRRHDRANGRPHVSAKASSQDTIGSDQLTDRACADVC